MTVVQLIVSLALIGFILYAVNAWVPMEAHIKKIINVVVIAFVVIWLLYLFGLLPSINSVRVEPIR